MSDVVLYGPDNRPINTKVLQREIAGHVTSVRGCEFDSTADKLSPKKLAGILNDIQEDPTDFLTLAIEMEERELHYAAVLSTRKLAVSGIDPVVEAGGKDANDEAIAVEVRGLISNPRFIDLVENSLDAIGKGFSVSEIIWETTSKRWTPVDYRYKDPRWFRFDYDHGEELRLRDPVDAKGIPLPLYKFVVHYPRLRSGLKIRSGLARLVAMSYLCKTYAIKDWMRFIELFAQPLRIGRYDAGASDKDIDILKRAVTLLGVNAAAILPKGMEIDFEQIQNLSAGATLYEKCANWIDKQISKAVLGQTMTTDDGSSQSQANVHDEVRGDLLSADARRLEATLNEQLVKPFVDLNFGVQQRYPRIVIPVPDLDDLKTWTENVARMVEQGLRVGQKCIRDKLNLPEPEAGEELLTPPASAASAPAGALNCRLPIDDRRLKTALNRQADDDLEEIIAEELAGVEAVQNDTIGPIRTALQACKSFEEMEAVLLDRFGDIDTDRLVRRLAVAQMKARGSGDH
ncbi:MAG: DUF935 domain-containing protein [Kiritimatiellales bacterium]